MTEAAHAGGAAGRLAGAGRRREVRVPLVWRVGAHGRRLAAVAALVLAAAVAFDRPELVVLATVPLALLALGRRATPAELRLTVTVTPHRCLEGDTVTVTVDAPDPPPGCAITLRLPDSRAGALGLVTEGPRARPVADATWRTRAARWGRWSLGPLEVTVIESGRVRAARAAVPLGDVVVLPRPAPTRFTPPAVAWRHRLGEHLSRSAGEGVEFAGLRPYAPGDRPRRINWHASARRGRLHVNVQTAERATDVVLVLDAFSEIGPAGETSLDATLRAACGLARAALAHADRVGLVTMGGTLRWLVPDVGERQFYRIAASLLEVRLDASFVDPTPARLPAAALPPGASVVVLSPLLDPRADVFIHDLSARRHPVLVVDPLTAEPVPGTRSPLEDLSLRLWRLDRRALRFRLAEQGIAVVSWDPARPLDEALPPPTHRPPAPLTGRPR